MKNPCKRSVSQYPRYHYEFTWLLWNGSIGITTGHGRWFGQACRLSVDATTYQKSLLLTARLVATTEYDNDYTLIKDSCNFPIV